METRKINSVCLFLLLLFAFAIYDYVVGIADNVNQTLEHTDKIRAMAKVQVRLSPDSSFTYTDALNGASPEGLHYKMRDIELAIPGTDTYKTISITVLLTATPPLLLLLFWAPFSFLRFIQDVKKEQIFVRKNVKRLRIIGILFLYIGIMINLLGVIDYFGVLKATDPKIPGYEVIKFSFYYKGLVVAFLFFLFAEVFSLGVRMKEEQDLTV